VYYLAGDFMRYACLLFKASLMDRWETKYGIPNAAF